MSQATTRKVQTSPLEIDRIGHGPADPIIAGAMVAFGFPCTTRATLINLSENDTYLIEPTDKSPKAVLRVCRCGYHSLTSLQSELAWMEALRGAGIFAPIAIPGIDGRLVQELTASNSGISRRCILFEFVEGEHPNGGSFPSTLRLLGKITAQMHRQSRDWIRPESFQRFSWDFEGALGDRPIWGSWRDSLPPGGHRSWEKILAEAVALIRLRLHEFGKSPDRFGLIHADLRQANILIHKNQPRVIDFDDCGFGWWLYDLASALSFMEHHPQIERMIDSWLQGYHCFQNLSPADIAEIPTFLLLRRILILAWMGSHQETALAQDLGIGYVKESVALAKKYIGLHS